MTITKHTPVVVGDGATERLDELIRTRLIDLRTGVLQRWLRDWLDYGLYGQSTTAERRQLILEALQRQEEQTGGARPPERGKYTRHSIPDPYTRVRPGSTYVACAGQCGTYLQAARPAVIRCERCSRPARPTREETA